VECSVFIDPPGRDKQELMLTDEPQYSESPSGATTASIPCRLPLRDRDRLIDAAVEIYPPRGVPWLGRVAYVHQDGDIGTLECVGKGYDLSRVVAGPLWYCHTKTDDWVPCESNQMNNDITTVIAGGTLRFNVSSGIAIPALGRNQFYIVIPETGASRITFSWYRPNGKYRLRLYAGTYAVQSASGAPETGSSIEWSEAETASGSPDGGATDVNITGTVHNLLLFDVTCVDGYTPSADESVYFYDIAIYGVGGVTTVTAPNVINHVCDLLPSWILPSGDEYRAWIDAGDTTEIEPLVFDTVATAASVFEELKQYRDYELGMRPHMVDGVYIDVLDYEERDDTPSYQVFMDSGCVSGRVGGDGIASMADSVRVPYEGETGAEYVDVSDTSDDNYLVTIDQGKQDIMPRIATASSATATLKGEKYLALSRKEQVSGSLLIDGPIVDLQHAEVLPCEIHAGKYIRVHGTPLGTIDARITDVIKQGGYSAAIALDNTPTSLDVELAILRKRQT